MIICHCSNITDHDINAAVHWMRSADPETIITPRKIYRALGKAADCGGCMELFVDTMRQNPHFGIPAELRNLRAASQRGTEHEGRRQSY